MTAERRPIPAALTVNKIRRKRMSEQSLFKLPPTQSEVALIHQVFIDTVDHGTFRQRRPDEALFMSETKLKNLIICHPEVSQEVTRRSVSQGVRRSVSQGVSGPVPLRTVFSGGV